MPNRSRKSAIGGSGLSPCGGLFEQKLAVNVSPCIYDLTLVEVFSISVFLLVGKMLHERPIPLVFVLFFSLVIYLHNLEKESGSPVSTIPCSQEFVSLRVSFSDLSINKRGIPCQRVLNQSTIRYEREGTCEIFMM